MSFLRPIFQLSRESAASVQKAHGARLFHRATTGLTVVPRLPVHGPRSMLPLISAQPSRSFHISSVGRYPDSKEKKSIFAAHDTFVRRHLGPSDADIEKMLKVTEFKSLDALIDATVPQGIRARKLELGAEKGEAAALEEFRAIMSKNKLFTSFIGAGYYNTITPGVILRNILENPAWYTPYTPYQAEISQGRLEMLLNFQTMVKELTGMDIANASLLDEATAAAEAMNLCVGGRKNKEQNVFIVSADVHPQTIAVVKTRAKPIGITVRTLPLNKIDFSAKDACGVLLQYPATNGKIEDYAALTKQAQEAGAIVVVASDLLALTLLTPPGEWGADVVVGSAQRFGVPLGYGGPHAAFFATKEKHMRRMPGRVIGVSKDSRGKQALRMAMQTREQHIKRDKATSNVCTAQALLANMAAAYAIYHGPDGLKQIATKVHAAAKTFATGLTKMGFNVKATEFFDTIHIDFKDEKLKSKDAAEEIGPATAYVKAARKRQMNLRFIDKTNVYASFDEVNANPNAINQLFQVFAEVKGIEVGDVDAEKIAASLSFALPSKFARKSPFLTHPVFNSYHSETDMLRYLYYLQGKDLSLATAMIPLGSCTMKLNATSEMIPVTWPEVCGLHPFAPKEQAQGYMEMLESLCNDLAKITGFHSVSLQPNAGSQGEYAGMLVIQAYHKSRGQGHRNICLIPNSAHGTNPATAVMTGMKVVPVKCDAKGNVDLKDLKEKAEEHKDNLSAIMVTYPSTHGVFEAEIKDVCRIIHDNGGQVYMDGANMNAQVGLTSPGFIGADVCHLNLHKTFCIPHGGGGPGMGPIAVAAHLSPFLPTHPFDPVRRPDDKATTAVAAAPFSSAAILPISYMYIKMMGDEGLTKATKVAILNANYMRARLQKHYDILYVGTNGTVAHEFIMDIRPIKEKTGITEEDIAKRLMDFNFHAPTMSFPVAGTLMVEPTESEPLSELDRLCDALIAIREEIKEVEDGKVDAKDNALKGAPHTADTVLADNWKRGYSREKAAYPLPYLRKTKFWPTVGRLDNVHGDRNLVCSCPPMDLYQ